MSERARCHRLAELILRLTARLEHIVVERPIEIDEEPMQLLQESRRRAELAADESPPSLARHQELCSAAWGAVSVAAGLLHATSTKHGFSPPGIEAAAHELIEALVPVASSG